MKKLALIDIDGVIADERHRQEYAKEKAWGEYFQPTRVVQDAVWEQGRELVERLVENGWEVGYLTGRREEVRPATESWLDAHRFPWGRLVMRPLPNGGPKVKLPQFKVNVMQTLPPLWDLVVLFDDDPAVVSLVKQEIGDIHAIHCAWHTKPDYLVAKATA